METLQKILAHWAEPEILAQYSEYLIVIIFLYSFLEVVFPPLPGDTLLILSGSITVAAGLNPSIVILSAALGTFCASLLLYNLGAKMERKILHSPRFSPLLDSKTFLKIERGFQRFGFLIILLSRFLPAVRSGVVLAAGIANMEKKQTMLALTISILLSSAMFVYGGRFLGRRLDTIIQLWETNFWVIMGILGGILILFAVLYHLYRNYRQKHGRDRGKE